MNDRIQLETVAENYYDIVAGQNRVKEYLKTVGYSKTFKTDNGSITEEDIERLSVYVDGEIFLDFNEYRDLILIRDDEGRAYTQTELEEILEHELQDLGI